jgi:hypothetical protein
LQTALQRNGTIRPPGPVLQASSGMMAFFKRWSAQKKAHSECHEPKES